MKLETKRLVLRQVRMKDCENIVRNLNNFEISKWILTVPYPYKLKDAKWWVNHVAEKAKDKPRKDYQFGIELKAEKNVIGGIGLHKVDRTQGVAEVGYWLGQNYWRQGYGSEALSALLNFAFNRLKLRRLEAGVFAGNPSSGKLLEKYGFRREGFKKEARICKADGEIKDEILYGLLRRGYQKNKKDLDAVQKRL